MSAYNGLNLIQYLGSWTAVRALIVFITGIRLLLVGLFVSLAASGDSFGLAVGFAIVVVAAFLIFIALHLRKSNPHILVEMVSWPISFIAVGALLWSVLTWIF